MPGTDAGISMHSALCVMQQRGHGRGAQCPHADVRGPLTGQTGGRRPYGGRGPGDGSGEARETGRG